MVKTAKIAPSTHAPITSAEAAKANEKWLAKFEGAMFSRKVPLQAPTVVHAMKRSFMHFGKNVHYISVYGRILLGEADVLQPEKAIYDELAAARAKLEQRIGAFKAAVADAGIDENEMAVYNGSTEDLCVFIPAQTKLLEVATLADEMLRLVHTLWLHGEIPDTEKPKAEFEVKQLLRKIVGVSRRMRNYLRDVTAKRAAAGDKEAQEALEEDSAVNNEEHPDDVQAAAEVQLPALESSLAPAAA